MTVLPAAISTEAAILVAVAGVFIVMGFVLLLDIGNMADRMARRGARVKRGYSRAELMIDENMGFQPATRAGVRRLGAAGIVFFGLAIVAILLGY